MPRKAATKLPAVTKVTTINPETGNAITLTMEVIENCEKLYRMGVLDNMIANYLGINPKLLREWLVKGAAFNNGLHGELFRRCAKAVSGTHIEMVAEMRNYSFGKAAEFEFEVITAPDGTVTKRVALDGEGKPIVKRAEIKGNPTWLAWLMERRFKKTFGKQEEVDLHESLIDSGMLDAALNPEDDPNGDEKEVNLSLLNDDEQVKLLEAALKSKKAQNANKL